jgi:DNA-binding CsgD family transcriptional regulator
MALLTAREREVASLLTQGYNQREIAAKLGIAYCTVTTHVANAREKAGARSAVDLALKVQANQ